MAVQFNAEEGYISTDAAAPRTLYTVTCWCYLSVDRNAFSTVWGSSASDTNYQILQTTSNGQRLAVVPNSSANVLGPTMTVGTWYKVAVTRNGNAVQMLYAAEGTSTLTVVSGTFSDPSDGNTATTFRVGGSAFAGEWLNGRVHAIKQWSSVLTQTEIEAELAQTAPVRTSGLVRYYPFLDSDDLAGLDESGNGYHLTASGTPTLAAGPNIPVGGAPARTADFMPFFGL